MHVPSHRLIFPSVGKAIDIYELMAAPTLSVRKE